MKEPLDAAALLVRDNTSSTDSDDDVVDQDEEEEEPGHRILKNVTDIVPVKYTPIASSKNSRSSSCIFKGSHSKAGENHQQSTNFAHSRVQETSSKQCVKTSYEDPSKLKNSDLEYLGGDENG